jgi:hypothetical protein
LYHTALISKKSCDSPGLQLGWKGLGDKKRKERGQEGRKVERGLEEREGERAGGGRKGRGRKVERGGKVEVVGRAEWKGKPYISAFPEKTHPGSE